ncbi:hypothetical protein L21SP2_1574 [Salinispira pacifica]|uniref:Uncharacterized protein n=1 Tax=Salinispira pacifica TaxID=1307761 RepID=V5WGP7_9SPIO|nr:hypothetical protein L21SP2_1574 [Salinispira pacifica]
MSRGPGYFSQIQGGEWLSSFSQRVWQLVRQLVLHLFTPSNTPAFKYSGR